MVGDTLPDCQHAVTDPSQMPQFIQVLESTRSFA